MFLSYIYLSLSVLGGGITYLFFSPWAIESRLDFQFLFKTISDSSVLFIIFLSIVVLVFIIIEGKSLKINYLWIPILGTFFLGVGFSLPFFLYMREVYFHKEIQ